MKAHFAGATTLDMRQTRKGWFQECFGCEANTEFKIFIGDQQIAHALEESDCFCRICCNSCHPFKMSVKELNTEAELLNFERPTRCCSDPCKCCCYQEGIISSGGQELGSIQETCWFW